MGVYDCDNYNDLMARIDKVKTPIRQFNSPTQMSGTSDTISRQAALHIITSYNGVVDKSVAKRLLIQLPSAQPEIVHCKDCKFSNEDIFDRGLYCKHEGTLFDVEDNHYCSWAERK